MHEGHRGRMREKYLKGGEEGLLDHELLEILLFYCIPRSNTNEIAHELLKKFGTLDGVANADYYALQTVHGIGENAALFLNLLGTFNRKCAQSTVRDTKSFHHISVAREFGEAMLRGYPNEQLWALLLDNRLKKIDFVRVNEGTVNHVSFDLEEFYLSCLGRSVSAIILYHNHPKGLAIPSREDLNLTYQIENKLLDVGIHLLEHFVVSDRSCVPMLYTQGAAVRSACGNKLDKQTLESFYMD